MSCQNPPKLRKPTCVMWKDIPVLFFPKSREKRLDSSKVLSPHPWHTWKFHSKWHANVAQSHSIARLTNFVFLVQVNFQQCSSDLYWLFWHTLHLSHHTTCVALPPSKTLFAHKNKPLAGLETAANTVAKLQLDLLDHLQIEDVTDFFPPNFELLSWPVECLVLTSRPCQDVEWRRGVICS